MPIAEDRLLTFADLKARNLVGTRTTLYRQLKEGKFPEPIRLPSGGLRWDPRTIESWLTRLRLQAAKRDQEKREDQPTAA